MITKAKATKADSAATSHVNHARDSRTMRAIGMLSDVADQPQTRLLCGAMIVAAIWRGNDRLLKAGVSAFAAHSLATDVKNAIKAVVDRTRPQSGDDSKIRAGDSDAHSEGSFPSGHSAGAFAAAEAFAHVYPQYAIPARTAALVVSAAQVPRGAHYVGDVIAGALIGVVSERATGSVITFALETGKALQRRQS